jgi:hypothetical protein
MSLAVNSKSAARECVEQADGADADLIILLTSVGHNAAQLVSSARAVAPGATVIGCTGSGVISNEGVSEKMRALACMCVKGREMAVAFRAGLDGRNSRALAVEAAEEVKGKLDGIQQVLVLTTGLDLAGDEVIAGLESVLGADMPLIGGTSADNGKAKRTTQFHDDDVVTDGLIVVALADPTLELVSGAHHGSTPIGTPFEITRSEANHVFEINGEPAWPFLMGRLGAPADSHPSAVLPIAGLGAALSEEDAADYHNSHVLCVAFKVDDDRQSFWLPRTAPPGTRFVLVQRDEDLIFGGVDALVGRLKDQLGDRQPVAVFHADCMARGRLMFDRVLKDEIITRMQAPLLDAEAPVPWLGLYGYGEFCPLNGHNQFHAYTTSLFVLARRA